MTCRFAHCLGGILVLMSIASTGCSALKWGKAKEIAPVEPMCQCTVDFRPAKKKPQVGEIEIPESATVQSVLDKSGAFRKFARMDVELYRQLPNGGWHKMDVEYDRGSKKVDPTTDYHVRAGDRVVITEDTRDILDDMMQSNLGPLGGAFGK